MGNRGWARLISCIVDGMSVRCAVHPQNREREREMFCLTTHSINFIYSYMASDMINDHSDS